MQVCVPGCVPGGAVPCIVPGPVLTLELVVPAGVPSYGPGGVVLCVAASVRVLSRRRQSTWMPRAWSVVVSVKPVFCVSSGAHSRGVVG